MYGYSNLTALPLELIPKVSFINLTSTINAARPITKRAMNPKIGGSFFFSGAEVFDDVSDFLGLEFVEVSRDASPVAAGRMLLEIFSARTD